jgi:protein-L-isoaspartate(D-aspartate) O-methyltransferase
MIDSYKHKGMRRSLVRKLKEKGIKNESVLEAINSVPRHVFFDSALIDHAYQDKAFPIGEGQTISQPYTVAFQTELLDVQKGSKILEIGTGSGYQACVLLELGVELYTIEYQQKLYQKAKVMLPKMGYEPNFFHGDGSKGMKELAPFDGIIVTAGAPTVPEELVSQLKANGKLVIPVGDRKSQKMLRIIKDESGDTIQEAFDHFAFVPLVGDKGW